MSEPVLDFAIVGGGVNGLSVAWQLRRRGARRLAVLERFDFGHRRGSSHGLARITRSSYHDLLYVALARRGREEDWPALECAAGTTLIHPCPGLFFGPDGPLWRRYAAAAAAAPEAIEAVSAAEARRRFPHFTLDGATGALVDRTAGVIAAERTMEALRDRCAADGVDLRSRTPVSALRVERDAVALETPGGAVRAERVVVAAGPWAARLLPALAPRLVVNRQAVVYLRLDLPDAAVRPGAFPVWVYLGRDPGDMWYGLPEFGRPGVKLARHRTDGVPDDPDVEMTEPPETAIAEVERFARRHFAPAIAARAGAETCFYTSTDDEDFILDTLPGEPRVAVVSACSGHGFKFGPVTGALAAELLLDGRRAPGPFRLDGPGPG